MFKMKKLFIAITFCVFLEGIIANSTTIQTQNNNDDMWAPNDCDGYCFNNVKPLLNFVNDWGDKFRTCEETKEETDKLKNETEISKIQNKIKDDLINEKNFQLKSKDALINEKDIQLKGKDELIKELGIQLSKNSTVMEENINKLKEYMQHDMNLHKPNPYVNSIKRMEIGNLAPFEISYVSPSSDWIVIQRRINGSVDFDRNWDDYENGFGDVRGEFFIGLKKLHLLTQSYPHELFIQMRDANGTTKFARYDDFNVGNANEKYKLCTVGNFRGTAGDSLSGHVGYKFTTRDQKNDIFEGNPAKYSFGGWWFHKDVYCYLNGQYYKDGKSPNLDGITWGTWNSYNYEISLTFTQMMIRPIL